jgi:hypothetical protein
MKNFFYIFLVTFLITNLSFSQDVWINEFSYNCADSSVGLPEGDEFVEIVAPVGTDMSQYGLAFFEEVGGEYFAYNYYQLSGTISSVNSNAGKGFFIVKTNLSHRLENYLPIASGISEQTLDTELRNTFQSGVLLVNTIEGNTVHGVVYEVQEYTELPTYISTKNLDNLWGEEYFDLSRSPLDAIRLPLSDGSSSSPTGSISMIGTGFSRLWTTTNGDAPNIATPGDLNYSQGALPVELSSFSAAIVINGIKLSWRTETEVNNYGFDIERKSNNGTWEKLYFVNGYGNSNSPKDYSYTDNNTKSGKYSYRLKQIDNDGVYSYSKVVDVDLNKKLEYTLSQNYPNPFNPSTTISFSLPNAGNVKLTIYNLLGQEIKTLANGYKESGNHSYNFDAKELNSGIYIYKLETTGFTQTRKMMLVK